MHVVSIDTASRLLDRLKGRMILLLVEDMGDIRYALSELKQFNFTILNNMEYSVPLLREEKIGFLIPNETAIHNIYTAEIERTGDDVEYDRYKFSQNIYWLCESADIVYVLEKGDPYNLHCIKDRTCKIYDIKNGEV